MYHTYIVLSLRYDYSVRYISACLLLITLMMPQQLNALSGKCKEETVALIDLVASPKKFLGKKLLITGEFNSFSTLPLDYAKAMRSSKDFIGLVLSRPDQTDIPLVELKLAAPLKMFKDNSINLEHGNIVILRAKVYAVALGEPWLEVDSIEVETDNG